MNDQGPINQVTLSWVLFISLVTVVGVIIGYGLSLNH